MALAVEKSYLEAEESSKQTLVPVSLIPILSL